MAREAGITRPIVYGHFHDLAGLLEALVERERRARSPSSPSAPRRPGRGDPRELLLAALRGYLEAVRADPATWRLVLMPPEGAPASCTSASRAGRAAIVGQLAEASAPASARAASRPTPS